MAVAVGRGEGARDVSTTTTDSPTTEDIPSILLTPNLVTADNLKQTLVDAGRYTVDQICTPALRSACDDIGLTE